MRTEIHVFREDQKATHGLLLYSFHTMEEPKYQLDQETVPTLFSSAHTKV